jgi:hypothetical protein
MNEPNSHIYLERSRMQGVRYIHLPTNYLCFSFYFDYNSDLYIYHLSRIYRLIDYKFDKDGKIFEQNKATVKGGEFRDFKKLDNRFLDIGYRFNSTLDSYVKFKTSKNNQSNVTIQELHII